MRKILVALALGITILIPSGAALAGDVHGLVTQKFSSGGDGGDYRIAVDGTPYGVPLDFYFAVNVGDTVNFDGRNWTIAGREAK